MFTGRNPGLSAWQQGVALLVMLAAIIGAYVYKHATSLEPFNAKLQDWTKQPARSGPGAVYPRGRVLPIKHQYGRSEVDTETYWALPSQLRASTPKDVGTVVWLSWTTESADEHKGVQVFHYGVIHICKVAVIDKQTDTMLGSRTFRGFDPRKPNWEGCDSDGRPMPAIINYLKGLERKAG
jgi:hypothetical protein